MLVLATTVGMNAALIVAGLVGILVAVPLACARGVEAEPVPTRAAAARATEGDRQRARVFTPAILGLSVFFVFLSLSTSGITNFSVVALMSAYAVPFSAANLALTAFLAASAFGVLRNRVAARSTFVVNSDQRVARAFHDVTPRGHAQRVLDFVRSILESHRMLGG